MLTYALKYYDYTCSLLTATIEYSCGLCVCVCVSVRVSVRVFVCVHDNSKNNGSIHLKLEHIVEYTRILERTS